MGTNGKKTKKTKYHLFEIVLYVQDETQEPQNRQKAQGLVELLAKGTPLPGVAQQFSQASSRIHVGDIGWVLEDEMVDEGVAPQLSRLKTGQMVGP